MRKNRKKVKITNQLDVIPLNWSKVPEVRYIFDILRLCFGPYNRNQNHDSQSNLQNIDTVQLFKQIHDIALTIYNQSFSGTVVGTFNGSYNYLENQLILDSIHAARLQSAMLNNRAVHLFLSLNDEVCNINIKNTMDEISKLFKQACDLAPDN